MSKQTALSRRIEDVDKDAAFVWISGESEAQKRGAVMVYRPTAFDPTAPRRGKLGRNGAFYVGLSQGSATWEPAMLRGVSRTEIDYLTDGGGHVHVDP
ncbi:MAG: hypothetical protein JST28_20195 [Acidobacteria bacterium]|nr:hypothetical protein [Acidobacteriota bacterium]